jgi:single-stranded DNA-binding protein
LTVYRYGFSEHIMVGRIGTTSIEVQAGVKTVRLTLGAKLFPPRRSDGPNVTWYDMTLWGRNAETFNRMNLRPGDPLGVRTSSLEACLWKDRAGEYHASLKGNVDNFWDLRTNPRPGERPGSRPSPGGGSRAVPFPTDEELAARDWKPLNHADYETFDFDGRRNPPEVFPAAATASAPETGPQPIPSPAVLTGHVPAAGTASTPADGTAPGPETGPAPAPASAPGAGQEGSPGPDDEPPPWSGPRMR